MRSIKEIEKRIKRNEKALQKVLPTDSLYGIIQDEIVMLRQSLNMSENDIRECYYHLKNITGNIPTVYIENIVNRNRMIVYKWLLKIKD